jgi:L-serine kinase (ATP) / ParB family transcriptional regulator, heme-responsive regulator
MVTNLPKLRILPIESVVLHEDHDRQRSTPLINKLRAQGILRNPPVVMPLQDGTGRYMVLDGANRVTSLQEMEFLHIVAQVVDADDPHVVLHTWNHVVWGMSSRTLMSGIRKVPGIKLKKINRERSMNPPVGAFAHIRLADGSIYLVILPEGLFSEVQALHGIVNCYKDRASLDRTSQTLSESFRSTYPDLTALIIFPRFEVGTVLALAGRGSLLPTGITRFTVSPRALHLNYPLHELSSCKPLDYKEAYLQQWIQDRTVNKGVRYYAEATFLFDE